ncbi:MAG: phosphoglycerate dehydrogenase [Clostridia bacterium]|nr:phosphoglycerate dehydrogenase [Clostridia bacterium]
MKIAIPSRHHAEIVCEEARKMLTDAGFELVCNDTGRKLSREEQKDMISGCFAIITGTEPYDADMLSVCGDCKVITRLGVGLDNYDLKTMKEMEIKVGVIANNNAVAEFTLTLILAAMKNITRYTEGVRSGNWQRYPMFELSGKTVGLVGFGRIGKRVAHLLRGFDVKILTYALGLQPNEAAENGAEEVSFETLLEKSDIISLHLPASADTYHMFDRSVFDRMKPGAYFINTSRGALVDEAALYEALSNGHLSGAGLDVFEREPTDPSNPLFTLPNVVLSPHSAAMTYESNYNAGITCARSILNVLNGGEPVYPVI